VRPEAVVNQHPWFLVSTLLGLGSKDTLEPLQADLGVTLKSPLMSTWLPANLGINLSGDFSVTPAVVSTNKQRYSQANATADCCNVCIWFTLR